jgi:putative aldouronate transport system permease protein
MREIGLNRNGEIKQKISKLSIIRKDFIKHKYVYLMAVPILAYYIIFCYIPMYGVSIAFQDFSVKLGYFKSPWVGFKYFKEFFNSYYFWRLLKNTLLLNIYDLICGFPAPIILALLLNEVKNKWFKSTVQTISYLPHFISMVVICGMILDFTATDGLINTILSYFGVTPSNLMVKPELFRTIYIGSGIWQGVGWGSIIYLAALAGIDPQLYEAATIDGAGRWRQLWSVTIPGIAPTIIILLILRLGSMMSVGFEKIILLYNPMTYETADVISTFVYRKGLIDSDYSYSTAVGLFNSAISFVLIILANKFSRKFSETSLW